MNSRKSAIPSRTSSHGSRSSNSQPSRSPLAKAVTAATIVKAVAPVGQRLMKKVNLKTGLAVAAGLVLAAGLGLAHKYRAVR